MACVEPGYVVAADRGDRLGASAGRPGRARVRVEEGRRELADRPMRGDRPLLLDLGQPGRHVPGDVGRWEGRLDEALAQQVEGIRDVPLGDVDIHGQAGIAHSCTEGHTTTLQQAGELGGGMPRGPLVEGARHDGRDAFLVTRLDTQRQRDGQAHRQHVLPGQVVGQHGEPVVQHPARRHGHGIRLRREDLRARQRLGHRSLGRPGGVHEASSGVARYATTARDCGCSQVAAASRTCSGGTAAIRRKKLLT
jgi:hypothetical protein